MKVSLRQMRMVLFESSNMKNPLTKNVIMVRRRRFFPWGYTNSVKTIDDYAFGFYTALKSATIPDSVKTIWQRCIL